MYVFCKTMCYKIIYLYSLQNPQLRLHWINIFSYVCPVQYPNRAYCSHFESECLFLHSKKQYMIWYEKFINLWLKIFNVIIDWNFKTLSFVNAPTFWNGHPATDITLIKGIGLMDDSQKNDSQLKDSHRFIGSYIEHFCSLTEKQKK